MKPDEFFRAVYKMRQEQKSDAVRKFREKAPGLGLTTEWEKKVDAEIERVRDLYDKKGLARFWEE